MGRDITKEKAYLKEHGYSWDFSRELFYSCAQRKAFSSEAIEDRDLAWLTERTAAPAVAWEIYLTAKATADERATTRAFLEAKCKR